MNSLRTQTATAALLWRFIALALPLLCLAEIIGARALYNPSQNQKVFREASDDPYLVSATHNVGKLGFTVSNHGTFGAGVGYPYDDNGELLPSCEYPLGSNIDYLFAGSLWLGGIVEGDTLVSVGADGWNSVQEVWPDPAPGGEPVLLEFSLTSESDPTNVRAKSEQDFVVEYFDILTEGVQSDPYENRPHTPLGVRIEQSSYAWSFDYAEDFVIISFLVENIDSARVIEEMYLGMYFDCDIGHPDAPSYYVDDITGFKDFTLAPFGGTGDCAVTETLSIGWSADNDGNNIAAIAPEDKTAYDRHDPTAVAGVLWLERPDGADIINYNWWLSNGAPELDWGPRPAGTPEDPFRDFGGFLGTPEGDRNKYYVLRHPEHDYDQLESAVDHSPEGWLPPPNFAYNFATGYDTRFLLSTGPVTLAPGETTEFSFAVVMGERFHTDPQALFELFFTPEEPGPYQEHLDFTDLVNNALMARWMYDNPGVDSDSDGYAGEFTICCDAFSGVCDTAWYRGDGVPDYRGAEPPPAPEFWIDNDSSGVTLAWNGLCSETAPDRFSGAADFEGYNVYLGHGPLYHNLVIQATYDRENFWVFARDTARQGWRAEAVPLTASETRARFAPDNPSFDPRNYPESHPFLLADQWYWFEPGGWNAATLDDSAGIHKPYEYRYNFLPNGEPLRDSAGAPVPTPPPHTLDLDSAFTADTFLVDSAGDDTTWYLGGELTDDGKRFKYYEYRFDLPHLLPTSEYFVAVTALDYGSRRSGLRGLESNPAPYVTSFYPINSATAAGDLAPVIVTPNPFAPRTFAASGFDYIAFYNVPLESEVALYTLDGDLVWFTVNDGSGPLGELNTRWDVRTRSGEEPDSGIYYWVVMPPGGSAQMGKLVLQMN
ncbi:MAG TPA: hypothetical protein VLB27_01650 [candidate division Zixibacteria bacterium]|nr:hypothetical protein [candidate division Zixibacteria bacterium]